MGPRCHGLSALVTDAGVGGGRREDGGRPPQVRSSECALLELGGATKMSVTPGCVHSSCWLWGTFRKHPSRRSALLSDRWHGFWVQQALSLVFPLHQQTPACDTSVINALFGSSKAIHYSMGPWLVWRTCLHSPAPSPDRRPLMAAATALPPAHSSASGPGTDPAQSCHQQRPTVGLGGLLARLALLGALPNGAMVPISHTGWGGGGL